MKREYQNGLTVKQLKWLLKAWPTEDADGEPTEVWIFTGESMSSPVKAVWSLNYRTEGGKEWYDLLLTPEP